jgi:septum formation protein
MEDKRNDQVSVAASNDSVDQLNDSLGTIELPRIVLASGSPRRAEILRTVGWPFEAVPPDVDETRTAGEDALVYVQRLARAKAEAAAPQSPGATIVGSDTVVVIDEQILGKPRDNDDARGMLQRLSGRWHQVLTGVALIDGADERLRVGYERTEVKFAAMNQAEISWYVGSGEPMDKAGAYAIQGLGARFIEGIRGDYYNVVGLPVRLLYKLVNRGSSPTVREGSASKL